MTKIRKALIYIGIFIISLCIFFLGFLIRYYKLELFSLYGLPLSLLVLSVLYFILTVFLLRKYRGRLSSIGIVLAIILAFIDIPLRLMDFNDTLISFPEFLARLLAVGLGCLFVTLSKLSSKIILVVIAGGLYVWFAYDGYVKYGNYLNFGTFSGKTEQILNNPLILQDGQGKDVPLNKFKGKYVVMDFWSTGCGACIRVLPKVQEVYDRYQSKSGIEIYSVFCCNDKRGETCETGQDILNKRNCSFPILTIDMDNPILKEIGVVGYPTVIIFDPDGKLIFRGNIEYAEKYLMELIDSDLK